MNTNSTKQSTYYGPGTDDITFVPLTPAEEADLFTRFYDEALPEADRRACRDELIKRHLRLVAKLSLRYAKRGLPEDEAISAGNVGLLQALEAKKFDPAFKVRFATYVRAYIRGQVFQAMRARMGSVHPEDTSGGHYPDDQVATGHRAVVLSTVDHHRSSIAREAEIESAVDHGYEELQVSKERREAIEAALATLNGLELASVRMVGLEGLNHADVARKHKVTRQASQQAFVRGMKKVTDILQPQRSSLL